LYKKTAVQIKRKNTDSFIRKIEKYAAISNEGKYYLYSLTV
jgi:hypothetical protein